MIIGLLLVLIGLGGLALVCLYVEPADHSEDTLAGKDDWSYETRKTKCQKLHAHERGCYEN